MKDKLIEYWFPINTIGIEGQKEKQVSIGRIPVIHLYFARRPTCAARAIILSSLLDIPNSDDLLKFQLNLVENYGLRKIPNQLLYNKKNMKINNVIQSILLKQNTHPSKIRAFDPFAGGGTFPLEMENLGIDTYASDLNPVAVLIEKATCEYPQKFGLKLIEELEKYFLIVQKKLEQRISRKYNNDLHPDNQINLFLWARQIPCPECDLNIPLIKRFLLSKKYKWSLFPEIPKREENNEIKFSIKWSNNLNGYYSRGVLSCPRCGKSIPREEVINFISQNRDHHRLIALYEDFPDRESSATGSFRIPTSTEKKNAEVDKNQIIDNFLEDYPEIDLRFPEKVLLWRVQKFGITSILKCFNSRQLLFLKALLDIINDLKSEICRSLNNPEFANAIILYLSFGLTKIADFNSVLTELKTSSSPAIRNTFKRAGLFMVGAYIEGNPVKENASGSWLRYFNSLKRALINLISQPRINNNLITIKQMDAMDLEYEDESMDFCFTDPPYYDNMPYASSMDFFYPWLRELLKNSYPELFLTSSTPKDTELIQDRFRHDNSIKNAKIFYEKGMGKAFSEIYRVLKKNGLAVIVFAHKDINAWETLLQAINDSKLVITSTWPLLMEMSHGMRTLNVVSLDSVVLLVCRKLRREHQRYYDEIFRQELEQVILKELERQWRLGLRGADFFLSSLGPAIEAFSKYEAVLDVKTDKSLNIHEYLKFVDTILIKFTLSKTLNKVYSSIDAETQFYLVWRASYKLSLLPYDEVWKFTHTLGLDDSSLEGKIIIKVRVKSKTLYKCLETLDKKEKFLEKKFTPSSLIEALQHSGFLWSENSPFLDEIINTYQEKYSDEFWHVAQALSNIQPEANETRLFLGLMRKYGKGLKLKIKSNGVKKKSKIVQKTFNIEGNNVILKRDKEVEK